MELLNALCYPSSFTAEIPPARRELWRFGISGNLPVLTRTVSSTDDMESAESLIKQHSLLSSLSCPFDLVFLTDEGGDYMRPAATALSELKRSVGLDSEHIHIIDLVTGVESLVASAVTQRKRATVQDCFQSVMSTSVDSPLQTFPHYEWLDDGGFSFYVNHSLPPRTWGNILTNGRFGFFATDCGTGHMWYKNAREYRINRWLCDSVTTHGTETLEASRQSLFAAPDDTDCLVSFGFGYARWEKSLGGAKVRTTAFVPADTDARVLIIEWDSGETLPVRWSTDLVLGGDDSGSLRVKVSHSDGIFAAESSESPFPDSKFCICSNTAVAGFSSERGLWLQGKTNDSCSAAGFIGISFEASSPFILVCGCDDEEKLMELCSPDVVAAALKNTVLNWQNVVSGVQIKTPLPTLDRLINGWIPYQTLACRVMGRCSIYQSGGGNGLPRPASGRR